MVLPPTSLSAPRQSPRAPLLVALTHADEKSTTTTKKSDTHTIRVHDHDYDHEWDNGGGVRKLTALAAPAPTAVIPAAATATAASVLAPHTAASLPFSPCAADAECEGVFVDDRHLRPNTHALRASLASRLARDPYCATAALAPVAFHPIVERPAQPRSGDCSVHIHQPRSAVSLSFPGPARVLFSVHVASVAFHDLWSCTLEDRLCHELRAMVSEWHQRHALGLPDSLAHQLTASEPTFRTLQSTFLHPSSPFQLTVAAELVAVARHREELRARIVVERAEQRALIHAIYAKWTRIRQWREQQTHTLNNQPREVRHSLTPLTPRAARRPATALDGSSIKPDNGTNVTVTDTRTQPAELTRTRSIGAESTAGEGQQLQRWKYVTEDEGDLIKTQSDWAQQDAASPFVGVTACAPPQSFLFSQLSSTAADAARSSVYCGVPLWLELHPLPVSAPSSAARLLAHQSQRDEQLLVRHAERALQLGRALSETEQQEIREQMFHTHLALVTDTNGSAEADVETTFAFAPLLRETSVPRSDADFEHASLPSAELERRRLIAASSVHARLFVNDRLVRELPPTSLDFPSFVARFDARTELALSDMPRTVRLELHQSRYRGLFRAHLGSVPLPVLANGQSQSVEFAGVAIEPNDPEMRCAGRGEASESRYVRGAVQMIAQWRSVGTDTDINTVHTSEARTDVTSRPIRLASHSRSRALVDRTMLLLSVNGRGALDPNDPRNAATVVRIQRADAKPSTQRFRDAEPSEQATVRQFEPARDASVAARFRGYRAPVQHVTEIVNEGEQCTAASRILHQLWKITGQLQYRYDTAAATRAGVNRPRPKPALVITADTLYHWPNLLPGATRRALHFSFQSHTVASESQPSENSNWRETIRVPVTVDGDADMLSPAQLAAIGDALHVAVIDEIQGGDAHQCVAWTDIPFQAIRHQPNFDGHIAMQTQLYDDQPAVNPSQPQASLRLQIRLEPPVSAVVEDWRDTMDVSSDGLADDDDPLLSHCYQWCSALAARHSHLSSASFSPLVRDLDGALTLVTQFLAPLAPPSDCMTVEEMVRMVRSLPLSTDGELTRGESRCAVWCTASQFLQIGRGGYEEHATLLAGLIKHGEQREREDRRRARELDPTLGAAASQWRTFVLFGRSFPAGPCVWLLRACHVADAVMYRVLIDPCTGRSYTLPSARDAAPIPLVAVHAVADESNVWANLQRPTRTYRSARTDLHEHDLRALSFELDDTTAWRPLFDDRQPRDKFILVSVQTPVHWQAPPTDDGSQLKSRAAFIAGKVRAAVEHWREHEGRHRTCWHPAASAALQSALETVNATDLDEPSAKAQCFETLEKRAGAGARARAVTAPLTDWLVAADSGSADWTISGVTANPALLFLHHHRVWSCSAEWDLVLAVRVVRGVVPVVQRVAIAFAAIPTDPASAK